MSHGHDDNVVYIGGDADAGPALGVLNSCADRARQALTEALTRMLEQADDALLTMAEAAADDAAQRLHFDALRAIRCARPEIDAAFRAGLGKAHARFVARRGQAPDSATRAREAAPDWDFDETTTLLDGIFTDQYMDEALAVSNMIDKVNAAAGDTLAALNQRLASLLAVQAIDEDSAPFSPAIVVHAFQDACQHLHASVQVKLIVYALFERFVIDELPSLYHELNDFLHHNDVRLDIAPAPPSSPDDSTGTRERAGISPVRSTATGLARLLEDAAQTSIERITAAPPAVVNHIAAIRRSLAGVGEAVVSISPALPGSLTDPKVIHHLRGTVADRHTSRVDSLVMDLIARIFAHVLAEAEVLADFRRLVARLQLPVLEAALRDKRVFSYKDHPTRRLLDALGEAAVLDAGDPTHKLRRVADAAIGGIITASEADGARFADAAHRLERALKEHKYRIRPAELDAKNAQALTERAAYARARAVEEIRYRLTNATLPAPIARFLHRHWTNLLLLVYVREGEHAPAWQQALATVDRLAWSLEPKHTPEECRRLLGELPGIVKQVRAGMKALAVPEAEAQRTLHYLATCHRLVVNGHPAAYADTVLHQEATHGPCTPSSPAEDEAAMADAASTEAALRKIGLPDKAIQTLFAHYGNVEDIAVGDLEEIEADADGDEAYIDYVRQLTEGTWITFEEDDGTCTCAKLAWISPVTGTYLFTTQQGGRYADKTLQELASNFHQGLARTIDADSFFDRAMNAVAEAWQADVRAER